MTKLENEKVLLYRAERVKKETEALIKLRESAEQHAAEQKQKALDYYAKVQEEIKQTEHDKKEAKKKQADSEANFKKASDDEKAAKAKKD